MYGFINASGNIFLAEGSNTIIVNRSNKYLVPFRHMEIEKFQLKHDEFIKVDLKNPINPDLPRPKVSD